MLFKLCDLFITRYLDAWKVDVITPDLRTQLNSHNPRILIEQRKHDLMRLRQQPARQLLFGVLDGLMIVCRLANGCGDSKATTDRVLRILLLTETSGVWTTNPDFQGWLRYIGGYKKKFWRNVTLMCSTSITISQPFGIGTIQTPSASV